MYKLWRTNKRHKLDSVPWMEIVIKIQLCFPAELHLSVCILNLLCRETPSVQSSIWILIQLSVWDGLHPHCNSISSTARWCSYLPCFYSWFISIGGFPLWWFKHRGIRIFQTQGWLAEEISLFQWLLTVLVLIWINCRMSAEFIKRRKMAEI